MVIRVYLGHKFSLFLLEFVELTLLHMVVHWG